MTNFEEAAQSPENMATLVTTLILAPFTKHAPLTPEMITETHSVCLDYIKQEADGGTSEAQDASAERPSVIETKEEKSNG